MITGIILGILIVLGISSYYNHDVIVIEKPSSEVSQVWKNLKDKGE